MSCPTPGAVTNSGRVSSRSLDEASGLVGSARNPGLFYSHNDSGGSARVYALRADGGLAATIRVSAARSVDWEDIAVGPGPTTGVSYVYVGDIGDNARSRSDIRVYRFAEPALDVGAANRAVSVTAETLRLRYPDGAHNAETLLLDPVAGELFVLTKHDSGSSGLYVARPPLSTTTTQTLEAVATLRFGSGALAGSPLATGGDISKDGSAILLRTYSDAFLWPRAQGTTLAEAFAETPCPVNVASERQGEAIAFASDNGSYFTLSEGSRPTLHRATLSW